MKRDVYPQKMHSCSKNHRVISVFVLKISVVFKEKYIMGDIAWYSSSWKMKWEILLDGTIWRCFWKCTPIDSVNSIDSISPRNPRRPTRLDTFGYCSIITCPRTFFMRVVKQSGFYGLGNIIRWLAWYIGMHKASFPNSSPPTHTRVNIIIIIIIIIIFYQSRVHNYTERKKRFQNFYSD